MAIANILKTGVSSFRDATKPAPVAAKQTFLDVTIPKRCQDEWCWAAVAVGVAQAYGDAVTQCQIAKAVIGKECCPGGMVGTVRSCNKPNDLARALFEAAGHNGPVFEKPKHRKPSFVKDHIDKGHPLGIRIAWLGQESGHFVVIAGYRVAGSDLQLCIWDPKYGTCGEHSLTEMLTDYRGIGVWDTSYETSGKRRVPTRTGGCS